MNCDFIDLKQETINCKGVNLNIEEYSINKEHKHDFKTS